MQGARLKPSQIPRGLHASRQGSLGSSQVCRPTCTCGAQPAQQTSVAPPHARATPHSASRCRATEPADADCCRGLYSRAAGAQCSEQPGLLRRLLPPRHPPALRLWRAAASGGRGGTRGAGRRAARGWQVGTGRERVAGGAASCMPSACLLVVHAAHAANAAVHAVASLVVMWPPASAPPAQLWPPHSVLRG